MQDFLQQWAGKQRRLIVAIGLNPEEIIRSVTEKLCNPDLSKSFGMTGSVEADGSSWDSAQQFWWMEIDRRVGTLIMQRVLQLYPLFHNEFLWAFTRSLASVCLLQLGFKNQI